MIIGIATVLAKIDMSAYEGPFSISFYKEDGSIRTIRRAQKGHKMQGAASSGSTGSNFKYRIKENGLIIIADLDAITEKDKWKSIRIERIREFNGDKVIH
jgi:hypothetical protein